MKHAKRLICLLMVVAMSIGIMACAADGGGVGAAQDGDSEFQPRVTISFACPQVIEGFNYHEGCEYSIWLLDKFNIQFEPTNLPWPEWHALLSTWIMAQDAPDVAVFNYNDGTHADAANFVNQGLIKRLPDDWRTNWPEVAAVFDTTNLGPMLEELYGGVYFLPRARFFYNLPGDPLANHWSLWMRDDWVEAVGFEVRNYYTIPEILEIGRLMMAQDPGDIGGRLIPLSMTSENAAHFFLRANSTYWNSFYVDSTGEYVWGAASEDTLEGLLYWYQAFEEGILDPEFFLLTHEQDMEKFQTLGIAGMAYLGAQTAGVEFERAIFTQDTGLPSEYFGMATLLGVNGLYHQRDLINYWGAVFFSPDVDEDVFVRWMDLMNFQASREGYPGTQMGIPGVDWEWDGDTLVSLVEPGTIMEGSTGLRPSLGHVLGSVILWDDLAFDNPNITLSYRQESEELYRNRAEMSTPETFVNTDWLVWTHSTDAMRRAQGIDYVAEFTNLITTATSRENLIEIHASWVESQMSLIQPVLDELNALS